MPHYIVKLSIQISEYQKQAIALIHADSKTKAEQLAIYDEAHDPDNLEETDNGWIDLGGEFQYKVINTTEVQLCDLETLNKYL